MSACRSCGAAVRWVKTQRGAAMPLDFDPTAAGNVRIDVGVGVVLAGDDLAAARSAGAELHMPHHATCPQGSDWRKSKPA